MSRQPASRSLLTSSSSDTRGSARRRTAQETAEILYPSMQRADRENRQSLSESENRMRLPRSQQLSAAELLYPSMNGGNNSTLYATNERGNANVNTDANRQPAQQAQPAVPNMNLPAGIRNNNPGNLQELPRDPWQGHVGTYGESGREVGFTQFDTPENGLRALAVDIISKQVLHNNNTIREIMHVYAPETDNNPTGNYINHVSRRIGVDPDVQINTRNPATLRALMEGIITFENGNRYLDYYSTEQLDNATNAGITHHRSRGR